MEQKIDQLQHQIRVQAALLHQLEHTLRQQADTANRRCDATFRTLSDGFKSVNRRLDQHELIFEAIDDHWDDSNSTLALV